MLTGLSCGGGDIQALAIVSIVCTVSPRGIILGGGVMEKPWIFTLIRREVVALLNN